jgi:ectoine hydroxylase-related dioxygenase (phytanoyl-CoA dioxygenase family)
VEQNVLIVFPGAAAQKSHTDVSPSTASWVDAATGASCAPLTTIWLALQDTSATMGPTVVYPRSHQRFLERTLRAEARSSAEADARYLSAANADGEVTLRFLHEHGNEASMHALDDEAAQLALEDETRELAQFGAAPPAMDVLLSAGDACVMDCRLRHYGGQYEAAGEARVLLSATFAAAGAELGSAIAGFTYHRRERDEMPTIAELLLDRQGDE